MNFPRKACFLVAFALGVGTLVVFLRICSAGFVNYDDPAYVSANPWVQKGLCAENVRWAFTTFHYNNWHPLTWLSYMLDLDLFGADAAGFHKVNVLLHIANTLLIFGLLRVATGALWLSATVAALFGWHPLHVESVAWISERKDVLSAFFSLLTIWAYAVYAKHPQPAWYVLSLILFACALMSKAMAVTLPFVLLLIDGWPLGRLKFNTRNWKKLSSRLVLEKLPFFALSAATAYAALLAQGDAVMTTSDLGVAHRIENATVSYARYLGKTFWPADLAVFYPHPVGGWPVAAVICSAALVVGVSGVAVVNARRWPHLFVGWFWFVGTLVPVIGLVQIGSQSMADRYIYFPSIGLFTALVWATGRLVNLFGVPRIAVAAGAAAILLMCVFTTARQVSVWHDSLSLFSHAERVTPPNIVTLNNLIAELVARGRIAEADARIDTAIRLFPNEHLAWWHAGNRAQRNNRLDEAAACYQTALRLRPDEPQLSFLLALVIQEQNKPEAVRHYREAIRLDPQFATALNNLAWILATDSDMGLANGSEAAQLAERACELTDWRHPYFLGTLAAAYAATGRFDKAVVVAENAIAIAEAHSEKAHAERTRKALALYKSGQRWNSSAD